MCISTHTQTHGGRRVLPFEPGRQSGALAFAERLGSEPAHVGQRAGRRCSRCGRREGRRRQAHRLERPRSRCCSRGPICVGAHEPRRPTRCARRGSRPFQWAHVVSSSRGLGHLCRYVLGPPLADRRLRPLVTGEGDLRERALSNSPGPRDRFRRVTVRNSLPLASPETELGRTVDACTSIDGSVVVSEAAARGLHAIGLNPSAIERLLLDVDRPGPAGTRRSRWAPAPRAAPMQDRHARPRGRRHRRA